MTLHERVVWVGASISCPSCPWPPGRREPPRWPSARGGRDVGTGGREVSQRRAEPAAKLVCSSVRRGRLQSGAGRGTRSREVRARRRALRGGSVGARARACGLFRRTRARRDRWRPDPNPAAGRFALGKFVGGVRGGRAHVPSPSSSSSSSSSSDPSSSSLISCGERWAAGTCEPRARVRTTGGWTSAHDGEKP